MTDAIVEIKMGNLGSRSCGDCQLCCKLLPVRELEKLAGQKCKHQKFGKGCGVYRTPGMPPACAVWHCRWLINDDAAELSRPDRSHYVIDIMPDYVTIRNNETGETQSVQVVQIWCDPKHPNAHRDPALRRWLLRRGEQRIASIVRYDSATATVVFPPNMSHDNEWHEVTTGVREETHSFTDIVRTLSDPQAKDTAA